MFSALEPVYPVYFQSNTSQSPPLQFFLSQFQSCTSSMALFVSTRSSSCNCLSASLAAVSRFAPLFSSNYTTEPCFKIIQHLACLQYIFCRPTNYIAYLFYSISFGGSFVTLSPKILDHLVYHKRWLHHL